MHEKWLSMNTDYQCISSAWHATTVYLFSTYASSIYTSVFAALDAIPGLITGRNFFTTGHTASVLILNTIVYAHTLTFVTDENTPILITYIASSVYAPSITTYLVSIYILTFILAGTTNISFAVTAYY